MADVVRRGADQLAEHGPGADQRPGPAHVEVTGGVAAGLVEAGVRTARAVPPGGLRVGVEVEQVGAVDELEVDRQVVVVELVDPVDQGDLLGGHVGGAEVRRVLGVREQREPVDALLDVLVRAEPRGPIDRAQHGRELALGELLLGARQAAAGVAEVDRGARDVERRVDVPGAAGSGVAHRGVEAHRGQVQGDGAARVVEGAARPGADLGMGGGQPRLHHLGLLDREPLGAAARRRDVEDRRAPSASASRGARRSRRGPPCTSPARRVASRRRAGRRRPAGRARRRRPRRPRQRQRRRGEHDGDQVPGPGMRLMDAA